MAEAAKKTAAKKTAAPAPTDDAPKTDDAKEPTQQNEATGGREEPVNHAQPDATAGTAAQVVQGNGVGQSFVDVPDEVEAYTPPRDSK